MNQAHVAPAAENDLQEIWDYIAQRNLKAADRLIRKIADKLQLLADYPPLGTACEELQADLRFFTVGNYVIYYKPIQGGIEVVRVVHGARDIASLFPS